LPAKITFDVQRLIAEVAARHQLLLKPDDAAIAIVTMNRMILEESLETIHSRVVEELVAFFENASQKTQGRAGKVLAIEFREAAAEIRNEIQRDIETARLQALKIAQQIQATYEQPMSNQRFTIVTLAAVLLFLCGVLAGRISAHWCVF
jgi:hypothetical protein